MTVTEQEKRAGRRSNKVSTVDLKRICPHANTKRISILEYQATDQLEDGYATVTWWEGDIQDGDGEERPTLRFNQRLTLRFNQTRQKKFNIVGVPFNFILVNGEIYYRMAGE